MEVKFGLRVKRNKNVCKLQEEEILRSVKEFTSLNKIKNEEILKNTDKNDLTHLFRLDSDTLLELATLLQTSEVQTQGDCWECSYEVRTLMSPICGRQKR
jgi:hypothetical protein